MILTAFLLSAQAALAQPAQSPFYARYGPLKTQKFVRVERVAKEGRFLEQLAEGLSRMPLPLSSPIALNFQECGKSNAYFSGPSRQLVLCYELLEEIGERASVNSASVEEANAIMVGEFAFVFFHELGHVLVHEFKLPITGREEDVADQFATYIALNSQDAALKMQVIQGGVWFFSKTDLSYARQHMADEHSLNVQRQFNIVCWAYGKDPRTFVALARTVGLPDERARRCQNEYAQMARGIEHLLPSGKPALNQQVPSADDFTSAKIHFRNRCQSCHGADGKGNQAMAKALLTTIPDLTSKDMAERRDSEFLEALSKGRGKMPPQTGLSDKELKDLVAYVRSFSKDK